MAVTQNTYTGNGSTTLYTFSFPYLDQADVKVTINAAPTTAFTFANATTIQFTTAPVAGAPIRIYRDTTNESLYAAFSAGSAVRAQDLNAGFTQTLYVSQETENFAASTDSSVIAATANTALANSATAVSTANTANTTANSATTTANSALTAANTATSTANTAATNATAAVTTANAANSTATAASTTASTASTNASNAVTTANAAAATANTASTNATSAVTTANSASAAVASKAPTASPTFTGTVTIPSGASIAGFAPIAAPTFTGIPRADTAAATTNTTQLATTAFVTTAVSTKASLNGAIFTGAVIIPGGSGAQGPAGQAEFYVNSTASGSWKALVAFASSGTKKWEIGTDYDGVGNNNLYFRDMAVGTVGVGIERARFNPLGYLKLSPTGVYQGAASETHEITGGTATSGSPLMLRQLSSLTTPWFVGPYNNSGNFWVYNSTGIGMYMANGAQVWTGTSDERLKTIIEPISDALEKVSSLRAVIGRFNVDPAGTRRSFLIAQDVQAVLPEAVDVRDDEIGTLGLAYSDVIPLLVAALKETKAKIESLEQQVILLGG